MEGGNVYINCLTCNQGSINVSPLSGPTKPVWFSVSQDLAPGPSTSQRSRLLVRHAGSWTSSKSDPVGFWRNTRGSVSDIPISLRATDPVGEEAK